MAIPFDQVRAWLFERALPFWATAGVGGPSMFYEALMLDGAPDAGRALRVRVIARQIYVYSHAAMLGWDGPGLEIARDGVRALLDKAWLGPRRGWARLLDAEGRVADDHPDLYDFAFILFALGWWMRASGDRSAQAYAQITLDFIERKMAHPSGRGHLHMLPCTPPYEQNPHMHLLEACLALDEATDDPRWLAKADEIAELFRARFCDPETFALTEYFTVDWTADPDRGRIVQPGHQLEWAWILQDYMRRRPGADFTAEARGLVRAAEARGVSPTSGLVYEAITTGGRALDTRHRVWPQTERIKGNLALFELTGEDRSAEIAAACEALLDRFLETTPDGAWIDILDESGASMAAGIPASTFYHLVRAFTDLLRLQPALEAAEYPQADEPTATTSSAPARFGGMRRAALI